MEKLNTLNVNDLYKSHEKLENNLKKLMNLLDLYKEKNEQALNLNDKKNTIVLSPDEEDYLENIIENKVEAIIDASKYNNKLKNGLYKLVDAFKVYDSEFTYSVDKKQPNHISIQTQTPPKSPVLMEQEVQAELNEMNEVIVLEPAHHNSNEKRDIATSPINNLNESIKNGEIIKETKDIAVGDDFTIDDILSNEEEEEDVFNDEDINTFINTSSDENSNNNNDNNDNDNILLKNNKILINEDIQVNRTPSKEKHSSTIINPINTKSKKSLKGKNRKKSSSNTEYKSKEDFADPTFSSSPITSSSPLLSPIPSPVPLSLSSPSLSQDIYLEKSSTQQATNTPSLFAKQMSSTKDAACQTESYKVVIHGEDYNIPPSYMGHYAVVPLWMIWVIGYYYKKKTKPKSMWKFLMSKTPSLLNKSRMQNKIINKVELMN